LAADLEAEAAEAVPDALEGSVRDAACGRVRDWEPDSPGGGGDDCGGAVEGPALDLTDEGGGGDDLEGRAAAGVAAEEEEEVDGTGLCGFLRGT